jgi:hypothetical protein
VYVTCGVYVMWGVCVCHEGVGKTNSQAINHGMDHTSIRHLNFTQEPFKGDDHVEVAVPCVVSLPSKSVFDNNGCVEYFGVIVSQGNIDVEFWGLGGSFSHLPGFHPLEAPPPRSTHGIFRPYYDTESRHGACLSISFIFWFGLIIVQEC